MPTSHFVLTCWKHRVHSFDQQTWQRRDLPLNFPSFFSTRSADGKNFVLAVFCSLPTNPLGVRIPRCEDRLALFLWFLPQLLVAFLYSFLSPRPSPPLVTDIIIITNKRVALLSLSPPFSLKSFSSLFSSSLSELEESWGGCARRVELSS